MIEYVIEFSQELYKTIVMIAPFLLIGFLASGILSVLLTVESVAKYLGKNKSFSVFFASLFGVPLPLCSCGVIPVFSFLKKHGANKGAATSFLISTPQTGVDSIAITWIGLGWPFAIARASIAFISGLIGGSAVNVLDSSKELSNSEDKCEETCCENNKESIIYRIFDYGFIKMPQDIGPSLVWGVVIAALIGTFVPADFNTGYSTGIFGMLIMLVAGTPLYMCATASVPIAVSLHHELGFSLGPLLVFLMAGPATNMVTINIAKKHLGLKSSIIYLTSILCCALFFGGLIEYSSSLSGFLKDGIPRAFSTMHDHQDGYIDIFYASALLLIVVNVYRLKYFPNKALDKKTKFEILVVQGMTCNHCVETIKKTIGKIKGVNDLHIDLNKGEVRFHNTGADMHFVIKEIIDLGFKVKGNH